MTPQALMSFGCFVCTVIQAAAAVAFLYDRQEEKRRLQGEAIMPSPNRALTLAIVAILGTILAAILGTALLMYHPKPEVIEKPTIVEKILPCPPAKSGAATTRGQQSPAITGSSNPVSYGTPKPSQH